MPLCGEFVNGIFLLHFLFIFYLMFGRKYLRSVEKRCQLWARLCLKTFPAGFLPARCEDKSNKNMSSTSRWQKLTDLTKIIIYTSGQGQYTAMIIRC